MIDLDALVAFTIIGFFVLTGVVLVRVIEAGKSLARDLELRHPAEYAEAGSPRPGYFDSLRRTRWAEFLMGREYEAFADPPLVERFAEFRRTETRAMIFVIGALLLTGAFAIWSQQHAA